VRGSFGPGDLRVNLPENKTSHPNAAIETLCLVDMVEGNRTILSLRVSIEEQTEK